MKTRVVAVAFSKGKVDGLWLSNYLISQYIDINKLNTYKNIINDCVKEINYGENGEIACVDLNKYPKINFSNNTIEYSNNKDIVYIGKINERHYIIKVLKTGELVKEELDNIENVKDRIVNYEYY